MATKQEDTFTDKKLFQVVRELNVSQERVTEFLENEGYEDALAGAGLNAKITDEEAYLVLREEYADDAQAAERVRELREERQTSDEGTDRDEVATLEDEADGEASAEADAEAGSEDGEAVAEEAVAGEAADEPEAAAGEEAADAAAESEDAEEQAADEEADDQQAAAEAAGEASAEEADAEAAVADEPEEETVPEGAASDVSDTGDAVAEGVPAEEAATDEADADEADAEEAAAEEAVAEETAADGAAADAQQADGAAEEAVAEEEASDDAAEEAAADADAEEASDEAVAETADDAGDEGAEEAAAEETVAEEAAGDEDGAADEEAADAVAETVGVTPSDTKLDVVTARRNVEVDDIKAATVEGMADEEEEVDETLRADRYRLSGTQVLGKVDLDQLKRPKRKRKRKKKEEEDKKKRKKQKKKDRQSKKSKKSKSKKKKKDRGVDEEDVEQTIQETLQELEQGASRARQRRRRRRRERHERERQRRKERRAEREDVIRITEFVTTGELANLMGEPVNDVISTLFDAGMMVSINQRLDRETIEFVVDEYDMEVDFIEEFADDTVEIEEDDPADLEPRPPVVTVMGHVDHGKTSLLDYIRNANVVAGEEGGITQHVGAHRVVLPDQDDESITFLDTPGHEAFTAMRARGAKATDIVILVVAADDSVMPQTIEAINHAQAADVPIVVAINKMDLQEADPDKVKGELAEHNVLVEEYGGDVQVAEVSAETGEGISELMEKVLLQSEIMELQANPNREASGVVIESRLEKGRGNVVTVLVQNGTLEVGDPFLAGIHSGSVRAMFDERDNRIEQAGPAQPALVLGCDGSPEVGDQFVVLEDEGEARDIASERQRIHREQELRRKSQVSLDQVSRQMAEGEFQELNLIVKADVGGSVEALSDALLKLKTDEVAVNIIHSGVGAITESDVMLARASEAVILGFQVRPTSGARSAADREEVDIRTYSIIYDAIEDVRDALEGLLSPERHEETRGYAEVRETFKVPDVGMVAGAYVTEGKIHRNHKVRVVREGVVTYEGEISSLKRFQEDVKEVQSGYECGISIEKFDDIKVGDEIESYEIVEEKRTLEV